MSSPVPTPPASAPASAPGDTAPLRATPDAAAARPAYRPSIRTLVAIIVIVPVLLASGALVALSTITARRVAEELGASIVDAAGARVAAEVRDYLSAAVRVSDLYARRVNDGVLSTAQLRAWERPMLDDLITTPDVASICFGNDRGEAVWLLRGLHGLEVGRVAGPGPDQAVEWPIDARGVVSETPNRVYQYDPRARPWFSAARKAGGPVWTPIYFWYGNQGADSATGTGYTRPLSPPMASASGAAAEPAGVLVVDVTLAGLSDFLRALPAARSGAVFLIDEHNLLVASSDGPVNTAKGERLRIELADTPAARAAALAIGPIDRPRGEALPPTRIIIDGEAARVQVTPVAPFPGIRWRCIAIVKESAFMQDAAALQRHSIILALCAVLGALILGFVLSRRLSAPLVQLAEHVKRVGAGDFDSRLDLNQARELQQVSAELNKAAAGLKQHMEMQESIHVAMEVQSSLLPDKDPEIPGLDIAGRTRYCDATGGDYYDFIDVSRISRETVLLALGDVMGHGVASALLMASARAALRAHADDHGSLATLMQKVNTVLSRDARHKRFMTMALLAVDPKQGTARWASAGHDPTMVYFPDGDRFEELEGGDLPLGMMEDVQYEEYRRDGLTKGCILLIGTDGIWEMRSPDGHFYGKDRLLDLVRSHAHRPAKEIAEALEIALSAWRADLAAQDDVTFVIAKIR